MALHMKLICSIYIGTTREVLRSASFPEYHQVRNRCYVHVEMLCFQYQGKVATAVSLHLLQAPRPQDRRLQQLRALRGQRNAQSYILEAAAHRLRWSSLTVCGNVMKSQSILIINSLAIDLKLVSKMTLYVSPGSTETLVGAKI